MGDLPGDEVCAYAWMMARKSHCRLNGWGVVHPDNRGRGLGSALLDLVEKRAMEHAALAPPDEPVIHATNVAAPDEAAHELLRRRGFNLVRRFWGMDGDMPPKNPSPSAPAKGITIRTFLRGQDESDVHGAFEEAFAEHFGHVPWPFDDWIATRIQSEGFDPRLWYLAVDGDRIVGALAGNVPVRAGRDARGDPIGLLREAPSPRRRGGEAYSGRSRSVDSPPP